MKKIKILNYLVIALFLMNLIWFAQHLYYLNEPVKIMRNGEITIPEYNPLKDYGFLLNLCFNFLFLIGIFFVQRGLYNIIKKGFFNTKSNSLFRKGGLLFIISGFCNFFINIIIPLLKGQNFFKIFIGNDFYILVIGLSLYLTADLIQDGSLLKQENDLTI
ncbi:MAG: DUF2975 domain-containing protein [Algibacter sp.]